MSEYIIEWNDIGGQLADLLNGNIPLVLWPKKIREERLRERIVRCRDCAECEHWEATERKPERYICLTNYCIEVNPNGFCAWGERREIE